MSPHCHFTPLPYQQIVADPFILALTEGPQEEDSSNERLRRFGQTAPLLVWQTGAECYQLLSAAELFMQLGTLGIDTVSCLILPQDTPLPDRFAHQILHGLKGPDASPILQAHCIRQAQQHLTEDIVLELLALMELKPQRATIEELEALLQLVPSVVRAVHRRQIALKTAKLFRKLDYEDQEILVQLLSVYRPGGSKQYKLVEMSTELALRHNCRISELVGPWLPQTVQQAVDNLPQRFQGLLQHLSEHYWPERTKLEQEFHQSVRELQLPKTVTVVPAPSFEDDSVELRIHMGNLTNVREKAELIRQLCG